MTYWTVLFFIASTLVPTMKAGADQDFVETLPSVLINSGDGPFTLKRPHSADKIDLLMKDRIEKSSATSLNEAMDRMPGVDSQDYCVNCGAKRISINGLRGDHTSVLIDGIPLYSSISSVYGYDAIPMQSVAEIEVKRGTGGALINPEAIGGTINIISLTPTDIGSRASVFLGDHMTQVYELSHNHIYDRYKFSVGGEFSRQEAWDVDRNGFAESPFKSRYSFFFKQVFTLSDMTQWSTRLSFADMEIIGGNTSRYRLKEPNMFQASDLDFENGDVRQPYRGDIKRISEYIGVNRTDATSKLKMNLNDSHSLEWNLGGAIYQQKSFYLHAFDYSTRNSILYSDVRWNYALAESQILTLGLSSRYESLRSESKIMYDQNGVPKDDFDYWAFSVFGQHEWYLDNGIEILSALRVERLKNTWTQLGSMNQNLVSPRLQLNWQHDEHLSQQLAFGFGYRMPLTSIESAHGAYDGFVVDIHKLEKSQSLVYSLSYNAASYYITPSLHYTHLQNMSYPLDPEVAHSGPLRFINDSDSHDITVYDILFGFKPEESWLVEVGYEKFHYPQAYKDKLPTAAIEERISFRSEFEKKGYTFIINGSWISGRNLGKYYEYSNHYNLSDGLLGVSNQKIQASPAFWQWDLSLSKKVNAFDLSLGVQNIFNYTQTGKGDSPAMWHLHDGHAHLDNRHVWGPNRGREYYLKVAYEF